MKIHAGMKLLSLTGILVLLLAGCSSDDTAVALKFYFKAAAPDNDDLLGKSLAISGDGGTMAVGVWGEDSDGSSPADDSVDGAGAVYVYKREVTGGGVEGWRQVAYVKADTPAAGANFGYSVALSEDGNILAVGAPDIAGTTTGTAYVYSGPNYDTPTPVVASDAVIGDRFGYAVALSDDGLRLAVGAYLEDAGVSANNDAGAVYVYTVNMGIWNEETILYANTPEANANFGSSVALNQDGTILAVGAWLEDGTGTDEGAAYIFTRTAGPSWSGTRLAASVPASFDHFGESIALSDAGTRLAVGAPGNGVGGFTGQVFVFTNSGSWTEEEVIIASNAESDDAFGSSVALSSDGNILLVGAPFEDGAGSYLTTPDIANAADGAGAAYRFTRSASPSVSWTERQYIKATNTDAGDQFGKSVSISDNGLRIVMGAPAEQSLSVGINGNQADNTGSNVGAAYLYNL